MLIDSVSQEFREDTAGMVCLCLMMPGAPAGMAGMTQDSWGQNHLEASSLICLAPGLGSADSEAPPCSLSM